MKIRDLPKVERPREKLEKYGPSRLTNAELLAILLRTGKKGENVLELSKKIFRKFENGSLPQASVADLKSISGFGTAKACEVVAVFELARRLLKEKEVQEYLSPKEIWKELRGTRENKKEHFIVFYLDTRNKEIHREVISIGTLNASLVHPREVFEPAIKHVAAQIIITHNHPSGNPEPSDDDIKVTAKLVEAGKILGIEVLDHIIVTKDRFYSFTGGKLM